MTQTETYRPRGLMTVLVLLCVSLMALVALSIASYQQAAERQASLLSRISSVQADSRQTTAEYRAKSDRRMDCLRQSVEDTQTLINTGSLPPTTAANPCP